MDSDRLKSYVDEELAACKARIQEIAKANGGPKNNLRLLYGLPEDKKVIYAESGGLANVALFPQDAILIVPIFPWSEPDLEAAVGPLPRLRELIEMGRVFPVIQHPLYYTDCDHLSFLFDRRTPSYFIRGTFAYSAVLGIPPDIETSDAGIPVLSQVNRLMRHCVAAHRNWLSHAMGDSDCWEYRYRRQTTRDQRFFNRIYSSLCYRYASVAVCIGQHNADQIISVFSPTKASQILLHLHILFDHVLCHGVGSDFVVRPNTPDGMDFKESKQTGVTRACELNVGQDLRLTLPEKESPYVTALLKEEHFLRGIDFSLLSSESIPEIQDRLSRQFADFRKKVEAVGKGKKLTQHSVQITLYVMSLAAVIGGAPLGGALAVIAGLKVPWLADVIADTLERVHRDRLASYAIDSYRKAGS
ncbi:MAG: hypothetical protein IPJ27_07190 [Candidatus Accumulibacter sp.]|uniref:Uncharacterized protein n=1 Tax=Candidatus Accumulibacter proximus TaxID=2954385 RepID=A0A935PYR9_9PROT|nr:hypothetical protein [Candidatus Accumulibacter proximus]